MISGFWKKSIVVVVGNYPNEEPEICFTKAGVTRLYSTYESITIQKNCKERLVCFGDGLLEFYPGLSGKRASIPDCELRK